MTPNRLHKHNDANIQLQRELAAKCKAIKNRKSSSVLFMGVINTNDEFRIFVAAKGQIKIFIPNKLKAWLKKDHDEITRNHKLLDIPAKKTVKHIIDAYIHMKNPTQSMTEKNKAEIDDFTGGLTSYFNVMLGSQLLYPSERPQHAKIMREHSDKSMANIYGAFHLLRMFVPLGPILNSAKMNAKSTRILQEHLKNFIEFIAQYDTSLFSKPDFVNVSTLSSDRVTRFQFTYREINCSTVDTAASVHFIHWRRCFC